MPTKIFLIAPLSNFEYEENLELGNGFIVEKKKLTDVANLIMLLESVSNIDAFKTLAMEYLCVQGQAGPADQQTATVITNSFEVDQDFDDKEVNSIFKLTGSTITKNSEYSKYLNDRISKMRLFKEGSIRIPAYYYFLIKEGKVHNVFTVYSAVPGGFMEKHLMEKYHLDKSDLTELNTLFNSVILPFKQPYINLCFENFMLSYNTDNNALSFLSLMMGLEVLFNPGNNDISYRIARSTAALLSKNNIDFSSNFEAIKAFYVKRSKCVHAGEGKNINSDDVLQLRQYLRRTLLKADKLNKSKDNLIELLNSVGFETLK